jgi:hypothetical protein
MEMSPFIGHSEKGWRNVMQGYTLSVVLLAKSLTRLFIFSNSDICFHNAEYGQDGPSVALKKICSAALERHWISAVQ